MLCCLEYFFNDRIIEYQVPYNFLEVFEIQSRLFSNTTNENKVYLFQFDIDMVSYLFWIWMNLFAVFDKDKEMR